MLEESGETSKRGIDRTRLGNGSEMYEIYWWNGRGRSLHER